MALTAVTRFGLGRKLTAICCEEGECVKVVLLIVGGTHPSLVKDLEMNWGNFN